jgi:hypothetical protein
MSESSEPWTQTWIAGGWQISNGPRIVWKKPALRVHSALAVKVTAAASTGP